MSGFVCAGDRIYPLLPISCDECPEEQTCPIFAEICEEQFALAELKEMGLLVEDAPKDDGEIPF